MLKVNDWVLVKMYQNDGWWRIEGSRHSACGRGISSSWVSVPYYLPVLKVDEPAKAVKLEIPQFAYDDAKFNGWLEFNRWYVWIDISNVMKVINPKPCIDCGWYCKQQCLITKISKIHYREIR